jgi:PAS domain S-box-containing protein
MSDSKIQPTGREVFFAENEIIVSKTDLRGAITYANEVFQRVSGFTEPELFGKPHNLIRHPDMPACVFRLLWDTLKSGHEIFAYVVNLCKNGDHYWVFAHVTPSYDLEGKPVGYHSNRRVPYADALVQVKDLYAQLRAVERRTGGRQEGVDASTRVLNDLLKSKNLGYGEFVFGLSERTQLGAAA